MLVKESEIMQLRGSNFFLIEKDTFICSTEISARKIYITSIHSFFLTFTRMGNLKPFKVL